MGCHHNFSLIDASRRLPSGTVRPWSRPTDFLWPQRPLRQPHMFESVVAGVLNSALGHFIEGLDAGALSISVFAGEVELKDLKLKDSAFDGLGCVPPSKPSPPHLDCQRTLVRHSRGGAAASRPASG